MTLAGFNVVLTGLFFSVSALGSSISEVLETNACVKISETLIICRNPCNSYIYKKLRGSSLVLVTFENQMPNEVQSRLAERDFNPLSCPNDVPKVENSILSELKSINKIPRGDWITACKPKGVHNNHLDLSCAYDYDGVRLQTDCLIPDLSHVSELYIHCGYMHLDISGGGLNWGCDLSPHWSRIGRTTHKVLDAHSRGDGYCLKGASGRHWEGRQN
jgi:hypothetical protein